MGRPEGWAPACADSASSSGRQRGGRPMSLERVGVHTKPNPTRCRPLVLFPASSACYAGPSGKRTRRCEGHARHLTALVSPSRSSLLWPRCSRHLPRAGSRALTADTGRKSFKPVFTEEALDWKIHRAAQTPGPGAAARATILLLAQQPATDVCFSLTSW